MAMSYIYAVSKHVYDNFKMYIQIKIVVVTSDFHFKSPHH